MLSLYIHIPFCVRKCRYCGFYSTPYSPNRADEFISSLKIESGLYRDVFRRRLFTSIYIGGGTPTVLSTEQFERVVRIIREHFRIVDDAEFTVEANPNSVTNEKLRHLFECGVTRLSLGLQSFSDDVLQYLGRSHTAEQALTVFGSARSAGFRNISIDLIYGIPSQNMTQWEQSLATAITLKPEHISVYSLSLDEGSQFHGDAETGRFTLPEDDIVAAMYEGAVTTLSSAGYSRYEISNLSLPGYACRHNMNYWDRGEYLGLGPGAWSFIAETRFSNIADRAEYSRSLSDGVKAVGVREIIKAETAALEAVFLGLRTMKGLDLNRFEQEYGADLLRRLERNAGPLYHAGILQTAEGRMRFTDRGILLSNEALAKLSA